ncbi:hypothetical protein KRX51_07310 [Corynebacterium sp. TAE3-ERU12]|uniref:DUF6542 domain-containing protein n=1 Tax=Corynebacterium sp. TAE3-ERU12 TaxID=2849491 RepID=UPI001C454CE2|nr:DUF6542 domain-containing protein [Corynebacterium sp. TAE3-ERU12]MBV7295720.1 hypothetical protein [Corynebacterium sp. TAE3-ERU12]
MPATPTTRAPRAGTSSGPWRLPVWGPLLLLVLASVLGLLASLPSGQVGWGYAALFFTAAIAGTALVDPRGLVLAVSEIPLVFTILTPITAWLTVSFADPSSGSVDYRTRLVTSAYPVVQFFPWLMAMVIIAIIIAMWRYVRIRQYNTTIEREERRRMRMARRASRTTYDESRARRRISDGQAAGDVGPHQKRRPAAEIIEAAEKQRRARRAQAQAHAQAKKAPRKPKPAAPQRPQQGPPRPPREDKAPRRRVTRERRRAAQPPPPPRGSQPVRGPRAAQPAPRRERVRREPVDPRRVPRRPNDPRQVRDPRRAVPPQRHRQQQPRGRQPGPRRRHRPE